MAILTRIGTWVRRAIGGEMSCRHVDEVAAVEPSSEDGCTQCLAVGDTWVQLRICLTCGQVGCCDNSQNTHATKHFHATDHPLIQSFQPGESWRWCYADATKVPDGVPYR